MEHITEADEISKASLDSISLPHSEVKDEEVSNEKLTEVNYNNAGSHLEQQKSVEILPSISSPQSELPHSSEALTEPLVEEIKHSKEESAEVSIGKKPTNSIEPIEEAKVEHITLHTHGLVEAKDSDITEFIVEKKVAELSIEDTTKVNIKEQLELKQSEVTEEIKEVTLNDEKKKSELLEAGKEHLEFFEEKKSEPQAIEEIKETAIENEKLKVESEDPDSLSGLFEAPAQLAETSIEKISPDINPDLQLSDAEVLPPPPQVLFREPSSSDPEAPDSQHNYFQELGSLRLQMNDWGPEELSTYIYDSSPLGQEGLNRINKEIKALTRSLPCEPSGAVFVSIDSSNLSRLKVLISGTEDTPYEHGLYLFDIKLDSNYPDSPPKMTIKTTGGGLLRFNPNLYDSGFVCLSIINTWGGDPEEMWNPSYSTLMQVFLSIQALVMDNDVIQKEPGYEHIATDSPENVDYCGIVKYGNIAYAMIDMIRNPPHEFKEIVLKHFQLKKDKILASVEKWVEESSKISSGFGDYILSSHNSHTISLMSQNGAKTLFTEKMAELKQELEKLGVHN